MASILSIEGIDEAISNLNYQNPEALKYKLVQAIKAFYADESAIQTLKGVDAEQLIKTLWDTGDDYALIKSKRKNLSSTKSAVNSDLKKLYQKGKKPEGVIIGRDNLFVMSDEAKDKILSTVGTIGADASLRQIAESLNVIKAVLGDGKNLADIEGAIGEGALRELRDTIQALAGHVGLGELEAAGDAGQGGAKVGGDSKEDAGVNKSLDTDAAQPEETDTIEELEDDEVEEVVEEVGPDDDLVKEVLAEDDAEPQDIEDVEDGLEEIELAEDSEDSEDVGAEDEFGEVLADEDEDVEEVEVGDDDSGSGAGEEGADEVGLPEDNLGGQDFEGAQDETEKDRLLAEAFDGYLGAMERFYNQYLFIAEGEYIVGSKEPKREERPEQRIRIPAFYIGKFPITNALFEVFVEKTGYITGAEKLGYGTVYYGRLFKEIDKATGLVKYRSNATVHSEVVNGACWYQPNGPGSSLHHKRNHPVVQITLEDAVAFAAWTGKRLPTEDEWEAAARTVQGYLFPWGNEWKKDACNFEESAAADTTPVDAFKDSENDLGIRDILGNVLEWTSDSYQSIYRRQDATKYNVVKGGSWVSEKGVSLFARFKMDPASPSNLVGFRCVVY